MKDYYDHIEDYIEGKLSSDEHDAFEAEVKNNPSLKNAVANYHDAKKISEGLLEVDMMATLNQLEEEVFVEVGEKDRIVDSNEGKTAFSRRWFLLIGLIGSLLLLAWLLSGGNKSRLGKEMILASYERPIDIDATRSIDTVGMDLFEKGKYFFALNRFRESEEILKLYVAEEQDENLLSVGYYWLGAAHLEQWDIEGAKRAWEESDEPGAKGNLGLLE